MKLYEKIIFGVCLIVVGWWIWVQYSYPRLDFTRISIKQMPEIMDRDTILKEANNGDLIFLCGTTYTENALKYLGDCMFSHIGILVRENDKVYIWDCDMGQGYRDGVRVMLLEEKLSRFKGEKIGCIKKLLGGTLPKDKINKVLEKSLNITFYNGIWKWLMADMIALREKETEMFCSEFVAHALQSLRVLPELKEPHFRAPYSFTPGDFFKGRVQYKEPFFHGENIFFRI